MPEVSLQCPCVVALVRERIAACVPECFRCPTMVGIGLLGPCVAPVRANVALASAVTPRVDLAVPKLCQQGVLRVLAEVRGLHQTLGRISEANGRSGRI